MKHPTAITRQLFAVVALLIVCAAPSKIFSQGPLTPPGAPAPTMKSLSDLDAHITSASEKRIDVLTLPGDATNQHIISAQGSYYLSGPLTGVSGQNGINIQNGNVKVDLNGYQLAGVPGSLNGVVLGVFHLDVEVRNGSVSDWGGNGIDLSNGGGMIVADVTSTTNTGMGIYTGDTSVVTRCTSRSNVGTNIRVGIDSVVTQCVATSSGAGDGINVTANCAVSDCSANQNNGNGVNAGPNCAISRVVAVVNSGNGIQLGVRSAATECVSNSNTLNGIEATNRNHLIRCTSLNNTQNGIHAKFGPVIDGCYCDINGVCGILVDEGGVGTIKDNTCLENGRSSTVKGAGIRVTTAGQCRLERNVTSFNYYGIDLQIPTNVVVATTATANTTNYSFVVGNHYGPIVDDTAIDAASAPAVFGSSAGGDINSTSPWANFSH